MCVDRNNMRGDKAVNGSLEVKFKAIEEEFKDQPVFYTDDVINLFPDLKKNTINWTLSKLADSGYIKRVRRGVYSINEWKGKNKVNLSPQAERIVEILDEVGFEYYISGTDVVLRYMQHVPEQFPVVVFVEKDAKDAVIDDLRRNGIVVMEPTELKYTYEKLVFSGDDSVSAVVYVSRNSDYNDRGIATPEKAFLDLYYAVTRNGYPISIQELARIYRNMIRLGTLDKKKLLEASVKRNLNHDIRFIVESKYITDSAFEFVSALKREI